MIINALSTIKNKISFKVELVYIFFLSTFVYPNSKE